MYEYALYLHAHIQGNDILFDSLKPGRYFSEDLFQILGDKKPFFRWLVIGPPRSGSSFHVDPSRTSAWNALLRGRKRWVLYPPGCTPPGVRVGVARDGGEKYNSPTPLKWLLKHYPAARACLTCAQAPLEVTQEAGELIYVPSGWWHMVLNLEETIAVTQNFANTTNFEHVWADLQKCKSRLIAPLMERLLPFRPDLFARVGVSLPADVSVHTPPPHVQLPNVSEKNFIRPDPRYYDER